MGTNLLEEEEEEPARWSGLALGSRMRVRLCAVVSHHLSNPNNILYPALCSWEWNSANGISASLAGSLLVSLGGVSGSLQCWRKERLTASSLFSIPVTSLWQSFFTLQRHYLPKVTAESTFQFCPTYRSASSETPAPTSQHHLLRYPSFNSVGNSLC